MQQKREWKWCSDCTIRVSQPKKVCKECYLRADVIRLDNGSLVIRK